MKPSDEEGGRRRPTDKDQGRRRRRTRTKDKEPKKAEADASIDFDGIDRPHPRRCRSRPGTCRTSRRATEGQVYYVRRVGMIPGTGRRRRSSGTPSLHPLRPEEAARTRRSPRRSTGSASRPTARSSSTSAGGDLGHRRRSASSSVGQGRAHRRRDLGEDRPAGRVAADLPRGLADQPRLLLRQEHARGRLAGDPREVRAVPARGADPRRPQPRHPQDAAASWPSATATSAAATGCTSPSRSRSACSGPTTRSPTAATASRRSTAA